MSEITFDSSQTIYNWPLIELIDESRGDNEPARLGTPPSSIWTQLSPTTFTLPPPLPLGLLDPALTLPTEDESYDITSALDSHKVSALSHPTPLGDFILCVPWGCRSPKEGDDRQQPTFEVGFAPLEWIPLHKRFYQGREQLQTVALVYRATTNSKDAVGRPALSAEEEKKFLETLGVNQDTRAWCKLARARLTSEESRVCRTRASRWYRTYHDPSSTVRQIKRARRACARSLWAAQERALEEGVASGEYSSFTVMPPYMPPMAAADRQAYGNAGDFEPPDNEDATTVLDRLMQRHFRAQSRKLHETVTTGDPFALPGVREEMCSALGWYPYQTEQAIVYAKEENNDSAYGTDEDRKTWERDATTLASGYRPDQELLPDCDSGIDEGMPDTSPYPGSNASEFHFNPLSGYSHDKDVLGHFGSHLVGYQSEMVTAYPTLAGMAQDLEIS